MCEHAHTWLANYCIKLADLADRGHTSIYHTHTPESKELSITNIKLVASLALAPLTSAPGRADSDTLLQCSAERNFDSPAHRAQRLLPRWVLWQPAVEGCAVVLQQHLEPTAVPCVLVHDRQQVCRRRRPAAALL